MISHLSCTDGQVVGSRLQSASGAAAKWSNCARFRGRRARAHGRWMASFIPKEHEQHDVKSMRVRAKPEVDWTRYHLQLLFVDERDTVRARIAAGLFDKITAWNGYGQALYTHCCGVSASSGPTSISTTASLMSQAAFLGIPPKCFARPPELFEAEDLDRFDLILALDTTIRDRILDTVELQYLSYYEGKVCLLSDFATCTGEAVEYTGGRSLLPKSFSAAVIPYVKEIESTVDIGRPSLEDVYTSADLWNAMVRSLMLSCAGLVKYVIDAYPKDLPHYDPL